MDKIIISDLKIFAYHGVNPSEKVNGQDFYLDITAFTDLSVPCQTDRLEDTVSYAKIIKTALRVFTAQTYNLIEKAAQVTAEALLREYPKLTEVELTVKKPNAPINAEFLTVAVTINRKNA